MDVSDPVGLVLKFDNFEVDTSSGEVRRHGRRIHLQQQPFQVLLVLLEKPGEVVTREHLCRFVWPAGTFVDFDHALNTAIKKIRSALDDDATVPHYVETIPKRGYRFIAPVHKTPHRTSEHLSLSLKNVMSRVRQHSLPLRATFLLGSSLLVLAVAAYSYFGHHSRSQAFAAGRRVMLVVLPFENLSSDSGQQYFCDGVSEELTTQLSRRDPGRLGVAARTTAMLYRHTTRSIAEIGRDLNVDYVIEGSVRREADQVRVTAQLIRASDQSHVWAADFDRTGEQSLALQSDIAGAITQEVMVQLVPAVPASSR